MTTRADVIALIRQAPAISIYPQAAPEKAPKPFVVYRVTTAPVITIHGDSGILTHDFIFECWGGTALAAQNLAATLQTRIDTSATAAAVRIEAGENDYAPETDEFVEQIAYRFWDTS